MIFSIFWFFFAPSDPDFQILSNPYINGKLIYINLNVKNDWFCGPGSQIKTETLSLCLHPLRLLLQGVKCFDFSFSLGCWWLLEWVRLSDCGTAMWPPAQLRFCAVTRPLWWMWLFTTHWARSSATPRMLLVFLIPDVRVQTERELYKQTELYKRSCGPVFTKISRRRN